MAERKGTNTLLGGGGFHHVAVKVHDFDAALRFYKEALGFSEKVRWGESPEFALLDVGDGSYLEVISGGPEKIPAGGAIGHFAIRTDDVDGAIERVRKAGMKVTIEPRDVTPKNSRPFQISMRIAFCIGPGGEEIEFFKNDVT